MPLSPRGPKEFYVMTPTQQEAFKKGHRERVGLVADWVENFTGTLRRPDSPVAQKLAAAWRGDDGLDTIIDSFYTEYAQEFFAAEPQIFLVEHDWDAVFAEAKDYSEGDYRLPYDRCVFEFILDGRRLCVTARQREGCAPEFLAWAQERCSWLGFGLFTDNVKKTELIDIGDVIVPAIRGICIALDAEIAYSEAVRAPFKLNRARLKAGRQLLPDFNVVKLRQRPRAAPLDEPESTGARRRLHFRRGHWRHFESHKTWIKWTLVGDPDMAFVDKHYRA